MSNIQDSFYTYGDTCKYQSYKRFENTYSSIGIHIIDTVDKLSWLINKLNHVEAFAIDTETTGLDYHTCKLVGIGFCWGLGLKESAYIPVGHTEGNQLNIDFVLLSIKHILEDIYTHKILHNAKYDVNVLRTNGIRLQGIHFDTIVAHYLLDTNHYSAAYCKYSNHKLDIVIVDYYPIYPQTYETVLEDRDSLAEVDIRSVAYYCSIDCWCTYGLYLQLKDEITAVNLNYLFYHIEMPLIPILADIEYRGLSINRDWYIQRELDTVPILNNIKQKAYAFKEGLNLNSPIQLSKYLFDELKLPTKGVLKNKQGYSINKDTVQLLQGKHPIIDVLTEYKSIVHLYNTFVVGILDKVNPSTGKLHPNFNQVQTDTGRLSCSNPNAQNFPSEYRAGIVPRTGYKFVSFDYSQCELRILAYLSQEDVLLNAFNNNEDVHTTVASILLNKLDISPSERGIAKTLNFGIIYGMQEHKLATSLKCSTSQAKKLIDDYWGKLPKVRIWFESIYRQAIGNGYTQTIMGRRRYYNFDMPLLKSYRGTDYKLLPNLKSLLGGYKLWDTDAETLRSAGNAPIQGSNADITKLAMVRCKELEYFHNMKMVLSIHDEIIFEVSEQHVQQCLEPIKAVMENVYYLGIPLKVDYRIGDNWKQCK